MNASWLYQAAQLLRQSHNIVAFTGAGISTPSGIPDFRSPTSGLWQQADPMEVASLAGFRSDPRKFYEWVSPLARAIQTAQPNPAHFALARLEALGRLNAVITQNIDALHTRAGSQKVLEVHGHVREATCLYCYKVMPCAALMDNWLNNNELPRCPDCGNAMKPNVILFGEQLPIVPFTESKTLTKQCDLFLVAGSSLEVFPVADLPALAVRNGAKLIIVNRAPTYLDEQATVLIHEDVAEALPALVEEVLHVSV
jgi:NAD-dependent deacetylase